MSAQGPARPLLRRPAGKEGLLLSVTPEQAGWQYIHFQAYRLKPGESLDGHSENRETALIVLGGRCSVTAGDDHYARIGARKDVWEKEPPYVVLLTPGTPFSVTAETDLHLAVAGAPGASGAQSGGSRLITPADVAIEHRGEGQTYRYIQHLLPYSADAARLILVEVYTPGGNWSSFPPHKHDTEEPPVEAYLEETYYHMINPPAGFAVQRVYSDDRSLDETMAVGDGDLVLVPKGYHPVAATPGHDSYYLNVMAGPTRAWNFRVDPDYASLMNWKKPDVAKE